MPKTNIYENLDIEQAEMIEEETFLSLEELKQERPEQADEERFLIISNYSRFASTDVWAGIIGGLKDLGHVTLAYPCHDLRAFITPNLILDQIVSIAVSTKNNFTHVLFIGSAFVPKWVIESIQRCGVKVIYWSLEDPHALDQNSKFYGIADYYLTNERKVRDALPKAVYMPTAGDSHICMPPKEKPEELPKKLRDEYVNDIVFCGNVYPNRREELEKIVPLCDEKGYKFKIIGITGMMEGKEDSPLKKHITKEYTGIIDHRVLIMMYGLSKISINLQRDPDWVYNEKYSTNKKYKIVGESLNPRAYEIPLCKGALQLIDNKRKELKSGQTIKDGEHCVVFKNDKDMLDKIVYYMEHEEERKKIVDGARNYVYHNHTYFQRAARLIKLLRLKEGKKEQVIKDELKKFQRKR